MSLEKRNQDPSTLRPKRFSPPGPPLALGHRPTGLGGDGTATRRRDGPFPSPARGRTAVCPAAALAPGFPSSPQPAPYPGLCRCRLPRRDLPLVRLCAPGTCRPAAGSGTSRGGRRYRRAPRGFYLPSPSLPSLPPAGAAPAAEGLSPPQLSVAPQDAPPARAAPQLPSPCALPRLPTPGAKRDPSGRAACSGARRGPCCWSHCGEGKTGSEK